MAWTFYDANGNSLQLSGAHTLASHSGTLAIASGGTASVNAPAALEALGVGETDSPQFVDLTLTDDLLLTSSGAVINFNSGNMTITHGSTILTVAGGTLATAALTTSTIVASGIVKTDDATEATTTTDGSLQTDGGLSVVKDAVFGDDVKLLSDSAVLSFGADSDTTLTHTDGTGLGLNGTNKITFNDASQFIQGSTATVLSLGATAEIDLTATLIDINGNADISGTTTFNGVAYTWPGSDGASGASLQTDASGTLSWTVAAAGVGLGMVIALGG